MKVRDWITRYQNGEFKEKTLETQIDAGWYDWFCNDQELLEKLKKMAKIIVDVNNDYILDNYKIQFYNRCPMDFPLFDEVLLKPIDKKETRYISIQFDHPFGRTKPYLVEIWTIPNNQEFEFDTKEEILNYINHFE